MLSTSDTAPDTGSRSLAAMVIATLAVVGLTRSGSWLAGTVFPPFMLPMISPSIIVAIALFHLSSSQS